LCPDLAVHDRRGCSVKYAKPALNFEQQAELLLRRGLQAERSELVQRLKATSYFRLSGYLYSFRQTGTDSFREGTTLESVWKLCLFDQRLRTLLLDAIEAIEVFVRTQLAYHFAHDHGPFAYHERAHLPDLNRERFINWQRKLDDHTQRSLRSREEFVVHFFDRYGDEHSRLPIWSLVELMDFGSMLTFYRGVSDDINKRIATEVELPDRVLDSWLLALNTVRNRCAHHSRLWNWQLGTPVLFPRPRKYPQWRETGISNQQVGIVLTLCRHLLNRISPANRWSQRVFELFETYPHPTLRELGLPDDWRSLPLWSETKVSK